MRVLLTGASGNVGLSTLKSLIGLGHSVIAFDKRSKKSVKILQKLKLPHDCQIIWGDILSTEDLALAVKNIDVVIHTAAIIPPLADFNPHLAQRVNVHGTKNVVHAIQCENPRIRIIFTSSIAVYGDRRQDPMIKVGDPMNPGNDEYAKTKIEAEEIIHQSGLDYAIFRLTYITSPQKLQMDPLMFEMPLDTKIEILRSQDAGFALAQAVSSTDIWGKTMNLAGGKECRTTYEAYLTRMMAIFGMGGPLPQNAFSTHDFHCGYMDTEFPQKSLNFQRSTLNDYYADIEKLTQRKKFFVRMIRPLARWFVIRNSPYLKSRKSKSVSSV